MRVMSLFDGIFWGLFFIIVGIWFMVRRYVPVQIPVFRVIVAVFFIWLGIRFLIQGPVFRDSTPWVFSPGRVEAPVDTNKGSYDIIFNSGTIDLSGITPSGARVEKTVNVVFGSAVLRLNPSVPARVTLSTAFGSVSTPDGGTTVFGEKDFKTPAYKDDGDALVIKASAVFGSLRIEE